MVTAGTYASPGEHFLLCIKCQITVLYAETNVILYVDYTLIFF